VKTGPLLPLPGQLALYLSEITQINGYFTPIPGQDEEFRDKSGINHAILKKGENGACLLRL
jgi:hypothetical protein